MKFSSFSDVLKFAIKREEEAARGYARMALLAKDLAAQRLLQDLEEEEKTHKKILLSLNRAKVESAAPGEVEDMKLTDYLIAGPPGPDMDFQELLIYAAKKEKAAAALYAGLAKTSAGKKQKGWFEFLAKQEKTHKLRLELEYERHVLIED